MKQLCKGQIATVRRFQNWYFGTIRYFTWANLIIINSLDKSNFPISLHNWWFDITICLQTIPCIWLKKFCLCVEINPKLNRCDCNFTVTLKHEQQQTKWSRANWWQRWYLTRRGSWGPPKIMASARSEINNLLRTLCFVYT